MSLSPTEFRTELALALPQVRPFAIRLTKTIGDAEDLIQATALRALEKENIYDHVGKMPGWLGAMMFSAHLNRERSARLHAHDNFDDHTERFIVESSQDTALTLGRVLAWADVGLSGKQREALALYAQGGTEAEIAAAQDCQPGTVKSRLSRAHEAARQRFGGI